MRKGIWMKRCESTTRSGVMTTGSGLAWSLALRRWPISQARNGCLAMPRGRGISSKTRWRAQLMPGTCRRSAAATCLPHNWRCFAAIRVAALKIARTATDYARENDLGLHRRLAKVYLGWARARLGEHETGTTELKQGLAAHTEAGYKAWTTLFAGLLAQVEAERKSTQRSVKPHC